jgi:hypothetical protein
MLALGFHWLTDLLGRLGRRRGGAPAPTGRSAAAPRLRGVKSDRARLPARELLAVIGVMALLLAVGLTIVFTA